MMLVPAGFLILMLLAAIAVDSAGAFLGQRQLTDALSAAANDAATAGLDNRAYYATGAIVLAPGASGLAVCRSLAAQGVGDLHQLRVDIAVAGPTIEVRGTAEVDAVFGRLIPHFGTRTVTAEVSADAQQGTVRSNNATPTLFPIRCSVTSRQ
jgi:Flp pilus assembly protein TadG